MNVESFRDYCLAKKGVAESFPFDQDTLVFKVMGKIFAVVPLERVPAQANLKCDPDRALELRETYPLAVLPGYHMNKVHWNTVHMEQVPGTLVRSLVDHSYDLIVASLPRKTRLLLEALE